MSEPTKIGKYEIRRQIGRGAMGVVYEAFDPVIERRVAIKTLRLELFELSQISDVRARFKREAQSAGQLAHPHVVTVYDYGEHEGTPYIVMEFLAGNELSKILSRGSRLPLSEVVRLMNQLLGALSYAHERRVVHRDVKPGNIFILDDGSLKVVDFGLAHVEASDLTDTGALLGTPAYMSPEQFLALPVDERSDIFSAGVILYELLTGDKPFTGSVTSIMQKVLRQEPMEPSALNPTLSTAWDTVVKRAMAKKPDARFQSARQFSETMKQVFEKGALNVSVEVTLTGDKVAGLGAEATPPDVRKTSKAQNRQPMPSDAGNPETQHGRRSPKNGLVIAGISAAIAIGAAAIYVSQRPHDEQGKPGPEAKMGSGEADVVGARKAGYSDSEILARLAKERGFDLEAARKSGYSDSEIIEYFAPRNRGSWDEFVNNRKASRGVSDAKAPADAKVATEPKEAAAKTTQEAKVPEARVANEKAADTKKAVEKAQAEKMAAEQALRDTNAAEVARVEKLKAEKAAVDRVAAGKAAQAKLQACPGAIYAPTWTNCVGTNTSSNGDIYAGAWKDGKPSGPGTLTYANGIKYVGEFKDGKFNGQGTATLPNGATYVGEFRGGMPNGHGTETLPSGIKYVGEFKEGKWDGQGTATSLDGSRYAGGFRNSKFDGQGTETRPNGSQYVGVWKDGKLNGHATVTFPNGQKYIGEVSNGVPNGKGTETSPDGRVYVGAFKDGNYNGYGIHTFPGGSKHVGEFKDSQPHGNGIDYRGDGSILRSGIWENGVFVKESKAGAEKSNYPSRIAGSWKATTQATYPKNYPIPGNFEFRSDGSFSYTNPYGTKMVGSFGLSGNSFSGTGKLRLADVHQGQTPPPLHDGSREGTFIFNGEVVSDTRVRGNYSGGGEMGVFELLKE